MFLAIVGLHSYHISNLLFVLLQELGLSLGVFGRSDFLGLTNAHRVSSNFLLFVPYSVLLYIFRNINIAELRNKLN